LELKEEQDDEEAVKATRMAEYERRQCLIASSNDPEDCRGLHDAFMASLNDKDALRGNLDAAIAMSIATPGSHSWTSPMMVRLDQGAR
jgi:hypothetical protein